MDRENEKIIHERKSENIVSEIESETMIKKGKWEWKKLYMKGKVNFLEQWWLKGKGQWGIIVLCTNTISCKRQLSPPVKPQSFWCFHQHHHHYHDRNHDHQHHQQQHHDNFRHHYLMLDNVPGFWDSFVATWL